MRDIRYDAPDFDRLDSFKASTLLAEGKGYCVPKAAAFAALARAAGIPARLGFADVTNHLATPGTLERMGGPVFAWHGYAEILIGGRWLKVSPTFDAPLCRKMGVATLEFDGLSDAHLQPFDSSGRVFMSYDKLHGVFHDVPARFLAVEMVPTLSQGLCRDPRGAGLGPMGGDRRGRPSKEPKMPLWKVYHPTGSFSPERQARHRKADNLDIQNAAEILRQRHISGGRRGRLLRGGRPSR